MRAFLFAKKSEEGLTKLKIKGLNIEIARCTDFESAIESTSEFTALTQALDEVNKVMEAYSEENIMGKIMSMDGEGCGLDADLLDGKHGSEYATDNPIVDVILDNSKDVALSQLEAWSYISKIETSDGSITAICLENAPTAAIPIQLKVVR